MKRKENRLRCILRAITQKISHNFSFSLLWDIISSSHNRVWWLIRASVLRFTHIWKFIPVCLWFWWGGNIKIIAYTFSKLFGDSTCDWWKPLLWLCITRLFKRCVFLSHKSFILWVDESATCFLVVLYLVQFHLSLIL